MLLPWRLERKAARFLGRRSIFNDLRGAAGGAGISGERDAG
jgi:hypothetical protein